MVPSINCLAPPAISSSPAPIFKWTRTDLALPTGTENVSVCVGPVLTNGPLKPPKKQPPRDSARAVAPARRMVPSSLRRRLVMVFAPSEDGTRRYAKMFRGAKGADMRKQRGREAKKHGGKEAERQGGKEAKEVEEEQERASEFGSRD